MGLTLGRAVEYLNCFPFNILAYEKECGDMSLLIRRYKGSNGVMQEERIDDPDRIERYFRLFEKEDVKKLETGVKVFIEKDEWQLLP